MEKFLKVKDIQKILGCGKQTAYDLVRLKGFPKITIGQRYYIPEEEFYKWMKDKTFAKVHTHI